ncbi:hypothetical protein [uncultured Psychroserpens sp.]|uniref:hypothetical protein n=1 Tax=uncultured Psychroserpens sp. TaxID=255436 RepID=UPI002633C100|nr:hypothetical protein [uncultured Psychroserpens sp.]
MRLILFTMLISLASCEVSMDNRYFITVENDTDETLQFHVASENSPVKYPDTILPMNMDDISLPSVTRTVNWGNSRRWEDRVDALPSDTLSIYFFHPDTLSTYSWDEIRDDYNILKRYDLSIEDLQALNFRVTYPPTPEMQNIRQYPPYE